jgi:hypothetical protein
VAIYLPGIGLPKEKRPAGLYDKLNFDFLSTAVGTITSKAIDSV